MIDQMLDANEKIIWRGKPNRLIYTIGSLSFYVFAFIWGLVDGGLIFMFFFADPEFADSAPLFLVPFFLIHLTPVWIAIVAPIYRFFSWKAVEYVVTSKRVYLQSGLIGADISSLEYPEIHNLTVDVGVLEKMKSVGTIRLTPDVTTGRGKRSSTTRGTRMKHIEEPYEVYKMIKQITIDMSTDYQYPNAYRPPVNTGYQTEYRPMNASNYNQQDIR